MKCLSRRDLESIAQRVLKGYRGLKSSWYDPWRIDPEILAEELLKLSIDYRKLSLDNLTLGLTSYGEAPVSVFDGPEDIYFLDGKTILIDTSLQSKERNLGRRNFTIAHECAHQILNMLFPREYSEGVNSRKVVVYRKNTEPNNWEEWQADNLASAILIPEKLIRLNMQRCGFPVGCRELDLCRKSFEIDAIDKMCEIMGVSRTALAVRMKRLGLVREIITAKPARSSKQAFIEVDDEWISMMRTGS